MAVSDFEIEPRLQHIHAILKYGNHAHLRFSTSPIFSAIRLEVLEDRINPEDIRFLYNGESMEMNTYGRIEHWVKGFCECDIAYSERLILGAMQKYNQSKEQHATVDS